MDRYSEGTNPLPGRISELHAACTSVANAFRETGQFEIADEVERRIQSSTLLHQPSPLPHRDSIQLQGSAEESRQLTCQCCARSSVSASQQPERAEKGRD